MEVLDRLRRSHVLGALILMVAVGALLAGCGGSSKKSSSSASATSSSSSATVASSATTSASTATSTGTSTSPAASGSTSTGVATGWTQPNGNLAGTRDVQSSINSSNVTNLKAAWSQPIVGSAAAFGNFATTPVIVNGVVYAQDLSSNVYAINLKTGKLLWRKTFHSVNIGPNGVNVADGKVYGTTVTNAFALSAATGEQLWSRKLTRNAGEGIDMAPAINNGTVYISTVPGNNKTFYGGDGVATLWAMNAATGAVKWKWHEVPVSLWGNQKVNSGGGQWQAPTFDAQGHMFLEVANPAPFIGDKSYPGKKVYPWGSSRPGKNLYTDSVVELNPATGKVMWYYQLTPHDVQDWDLNNQALITQVNGKEAILSEGKAGIAIANDAQTGKLLWKIKLGKRNGFDNTNLLTMHKQYAKLRKPPYIQYPGTMGGAETPYASDGSTMYIAQNELYSKISSQSKLTEQNPLKGSGEMVALDQNTGKIKWQHKFQYSPYGSATVSNDLVWTTTFDGTLWALNKNTGAVVWHAQLPAGTNASPAIDGNTVVVGTGYPESKSQKTEIVAYRLPASG
jgi:alcohol dehydrogenase (cytochrome c)